VGGRREGAQDAEMELVWWTGGVWAGFLRGSGRDLRVARRALSEVVGWVCCEGTIFCAFWMVRGFGGMYLQGIVAP